MGLSLPKSNLIFLKKCLDKWVHFNIPLPKGYPEDMTDEEMRKWIECWHEFDPCPDV